nr:Kdo domain containing protein [uncultured Flavobacterium sp.]
MKFITASAFEAKRQKISDIIGSFYTKGTMLSDGKRNKIKVFDLDGQALNIKSFRKPGFINSLVYAFFRKSKARRSFEFAGILTDKGIGTPQPIACLENYGFPGLKDSYYVCEHLTPDLTFRELVEVPNFPEHNIILRQFVGFSFRLHEAGIEFKDHSPGNTLIVKNAPGKYSFYLVDLNRMNFHNDMSFDLRMENLKRLTPKKEMVEVMSNEYAKLYKQKAESEIFSTLWQKTEEFQRKYWRKRAFKQKLKLK